MPLLRTAVQLGGAAALLNVGAKALDRHEKTRMEHDTQLQQQQAQVSRSVSPGRSSYGHQPYCNGSCGDRCNGTSDGYLHQSYCNGTCGGRCNGVAPSGRPSQLRHDQQPQHFNPQGQSNSPYGAQRAIGAVESGNVDATPPSYEDEPVYGGEASGKARDAKS